MDTGRLRNITISLTLACNERCEHCWVSAGPNRTESLSTEDIQMVIKQASSLGAEHVKFTGGEPLMRKDVATLSRYANECGMRVSIETNGLLLRGRLLRDLCTVESSPHFYVSLDGASPTTHDTFRKTRGAFNSTVRNLREARELDAFFSVHTVVRRENLNELPTLHALVRSLGASQHKLILDIHRLGRGDKAKRELGASLREVLEVVGRLPQQEFWDYGWNPDRSRETRLMTTLPPAFQPSTQKLATCGWGESLLAILADGSATICHGLYGVEQGVVGNVKSSTLGAIWERLKELGAEAAMDLDGICSNCAVKSTCRGLCRASAVGVYGDIRAPYPMCQELYEGGLFPRHMLVDPTQDVSYPGRT